MGRKEPRTLVLHLVAGDLDRLRQLTKEMRQMALAVENFPEDIAYSLVDLEALEDARGEALRLARECEAAIETFEKGT